MNVLWMEQSHRQNLYSPFGGVIDANELVIFNRLKPATYNKSVQFRVFAESHSYEQTSEKCQQDLGDYFDEKNWMQAWLFVC